MVQAERNGEECWIALDLYDEENEPELDELEANAKLIAKAPEMYGLIYDLVYSDDLTDGDVVERRLFEAKELLEKLAPTDL